MAAGGAPVRLAPHAWHVVDPMGFTSPQRRHLYGTLTGHLLLALECRAPSPSRVSGLASQAAQPITARGFLGSYLGLLQLVRKLTVAHGSSGRLGG